MTSSTFLSLITDPVFTSLLYTFFSRAFFYINFFPQCSSNFLHSSSSISLYALSTAPLAASFFYPYSCCNVVFGCSPFSLITIISDICFSLLLYPLFSPLLHARNIKQGLVLCGNALPVHAYLLSPHNQHVEFCLMPGISIRYIVAFRFLKNIPATASPFLKINSTSTRHF